MTILNCTECGGIHYGSNHCPYRKTSTHMERTIQDIDNEASEKYPSVLVEGHLVHVHFKDGEWAVWLNTEAQDFDGLCIGVASTRVEALTQAIRVLTAVSSHLFMLAHEG